jgi:hypothetical protein
MTSCGGRATPCRLLGWQHDTVRITGEMLETDHYLPLPDRLATNAYCIMERFCASVKDGIQDDLGKA